MLHVLKFFVYLQSQKLAYIKTLNNMRMKRLTISLRLFLTFFSLVLAENLLGQEPTPAISGTGTANDPFVINTQAGWNTFATEANYATYWASGVYVKLNGDYTVSNMVGTSSHKYQGTFDGNWHTLTFNKGTEAVDGQFNDDYCAPFRYINGATIKNLTVQGTIISKKKFVGGFVGSATGKCYITNCTSSINILCNYIVSDNGDCTHGGFVGREENKTDDIVFDNCLFDGWIKDTKDTKTATKCAGFVGWAEGKVHYTSCYMVGEIVLKEKAPIGNFHRNGTNPFSPYDYYNIRYLKNYTYGVKPGPEGFMLIQDTAYFSKKYVADDKNYYVPCTIRGLEYIEYNPDNPVELTPEVYYFSKKLVAGDDYTVDIKMKDSAGNYTINKTKIQDAGDYKVTIKGTKSVYFNSDAVYFGIITASQSWSALQDKIDDSTTIKLTRDFVATSKEAGALTIDKDITIYLNGHTIDRNLSEAQENGRVIEIASGKNVTIIGPGTITGGYKVAKNSDENPADNDGGGIYNLGNLTLENVTVTGNECIKKVLDESPTGRGGGIYCGSSGSFTMIGGKISENVAEGGGGGIFVDQTPSMTMSGVTVAWNTTKDKGAGMRLTIPASREYNISLCSFNSNSATDKKNSEGGAIYLKGINSTNSVLNLSGCFFEYNSAYAKGGAVFSFSGKTIATNCMMKDNLAYDAVGVADAASKGGSLYLQSKGGNSTYTMDGGSITYSGALQSGGAVFVEPGSTFNVKGDVIIKECSVYDEETNIDNNVYLDGSTNVIHVVGPLGPNALICVTYNGEATNVISDPSGYASIANFQLDNTHQRLNVDGSGNYAVYLANLWNDSEHWPDGSTMDGEGNCTIASEIIIPSGVTAAPKSITLNSGGSIVIEDGGQLVYNTSVPVKVQHDVNGAEFASSGWYTISSAVCENGENYELLSNINYMLNDPYDLYYYDEAASYWRNKKDVVHGFNKMMLGRGYIYRNGNKVRHSYNGYTNVGTVNYKLSCVADNVLKGFNLVGNPYPHSIAKGSGKAVENTYLATGYYVLTDDGRWKSCTDGAEIKVNQGILVQATDGSHNSYLVFNDIVYTAPSRAINDNIEFTISNSEYEDVAYATFEKGVGLTKISHRNPEAPMVYIKQNNKDYAIATMDDDVKAFDLCFEAKTTGRYTMTINPEGEFSYLHLIDKLSGEDIDMLQDNEYSFIGSPGDNLNRFLVRLSDNANGSSTDIEIFAYQSGNDIVVAGEGELQVFDVMGRMVMRQNVNGVQTVNGLSKGVYIMRLEGKTQKIVIR